MSESDEFLSRWSRRKREAARGETEADEQKSAQPGERGDPEDESRPARTAVEGEKPQANEAEESSFDLSKLPSIDSITADTDIRPFLAAGVPAGLRQAALRRAWSADVAIRDFIGPVENGWDFTGAAELPGFDFSPPSGDIQRMVADIFGQKPAPESPATGAEEPAPDDRQLAAGDEWNPVRRSPEDVAALDQRTSENAPHVEISADDASQKNDATHQEELRLALRRSHGGAMPR